MVAYGLLQPGHGCRAEWCRLKGVRFSALRNDLSVKRVWHFRVPELPSWLGGEEPPARTPCFSGPCRGPAREAEVGEQAGEVGVPAWPR